MGGPPRARMTSVFRLHSQTMQDLLRTEGIDAVLEEMDEFSKTFEVTCYLLDESGHDVRDRSPSPQVVRIALRAGNDVSTENMDRNLIMTRQIRDSAGRQYFVVAEWRDRGGPPERGSFFIQVFLLRITPVAIGLGLVCFFLARYITNPVLKLRAALRRFADGDLSQRVGMTIGGRRDEIGELAREFDHMAERIATLLNAQRRLLRDVSHELRSPLARQRVALELACQRAGPDAHDMLDRVEREAARLDELIGHVLMLTRMENDEGGIERSTIDVCQLLSAVVENADFEARSRQKTVQLNMNEECFAEGVPELLLRALENVVRNAVAYTAENTAVEVSLMIEDSGGGRTARIRVRDHGPGVPEAELNDIFRPFYRVSTARERASGGVGLGLAIAERAVRSHCGDINARNASDGGLIVEIALPCR